MNWLRHWTSQGDKDTTYFEVQESLEKPGCPICTLDSQAEARYLQSLFREGITDPDIRDKVRAAGGFCMHHAGLIVDGGNPLGTAILGQDLVANWRKLIEGTWSQTGSQRTARLQAALPDPRLSCPACAAVSAAEHRYLRALLEMADKPEVQPRLESGAGLCLPHLLEAAAISTPQAGLHALLQAQSASLKRLEIELAEFIRKKDYRFAGEPFGAEADAPERAVRLLSGYRSRPTKERL